MKILKNHYIKKMDGEIIPTQKTLYIDANRLHSVNNTNDNSSWEYKLNEGIKLPSGSEIQILQSYINYNGITGGSIEFLKDVNEEISFSYYKTQGSTFALSVNKLENPNSGDLESDAKGGVFLYDCQKHRNIENIPAAPLLKLEPGEYTDTEPTTKITALVATPVVFDISGNVANPNTIPSDQYYPLSVYDEYFNNFNNQLEGERYELPFGESTTSKVVIIPPITTGGINYVVGETISFPGAGSTSPAFAVILQVNVAGSIQKVGLIQTGEGYTSTPVPTFNTAGGTGAVVGVIMGIVRTTRTSGSGRGLKVGVSVSGTADNYVFTIHSILSNGIGYRSGDEIYVDENEADLSFFPVNHSAVVNFGGGETQATVLFTTALDVPSPGVLSLGLGEDIQYLRCTAKEEVREYDTENKVIFYYDDNDLVAGADIDTDNYIGGGRTPGRGDALSPIDAIYRYFEYETELKKCPPSSIDPGDYPTLFPGANYRCMPDITYTPSGYDEPYLNTIDGEPQFRAVMNTSNQLEKVVYLPGCRDDITASNSFTDFSLAQNPSKYGTTTGSQGPPGVLGVIGGNPDTQAFARFVSSQIGATDGGDTKASNFITVRKPRLRRAYNQTSGIKLGYNVVLTTIRSAYNNNSTCDLVAVDTDSTGLGGQVQVYNGYNKIGGLILIAEVITSGAGYKLGERYYIDDGTGKATDQMTICEIIGLTPVNNLAVPAQTGNASFIYARPNIITNGISENVRNSMTRSALFNGKSSTLTGDAILQNEFEVGMPRRPEFSTLPRVNYLNNKTCDLNNLRTVGGTNDLIGYCTFDTDGRLTPVVDTKVITVAKGIYSISEFSDLITKQFTDSTTKTGFLSESTFSKLIQAHSYEPVMFSGKQHNAANRGVFVSMDVFNALMDLKKNGIQAPDTYLWNNFHKTHYYSFIRSFFPFSKSPNKICSNSAVSNNFGTAKQQRADTHITYANNSVYDTLSNGLLLGSTDFDLNYNTDTSTFELRFLHSPFRCPEYDKFGNRFSAPAQVGAMVRKVVDSINTRGINKQYLVANGFSQKTSNAIINALENPITRETGIMVHNFSLNVSKETNPGKFVNPEYATFTDFFPDGDTASLSWSSSLFSRLGFTYEQLNGTTNKEVVSYYNMTDTTCYGITTNQKLDTTISTTISTLNAFNIKDDAAATPGSASAPTQQFFNLTLANVPKVPVFNTAAVMSNNPAETKDDIGATEKPVGFFAGAVYDSSITLFIQTDGDHLTATNLPVLIRDGYFILSSNVVDGYRDSIKKGQNIPLLGIVPKSNWQSQDFTSIQFSEITHITSNPKVLNSVIIDVYNPDLTRPLLRPDSTVMLKITLPTTEDDLLKTSKTEDKDKKEKS